MQRLARAIADLLGGYILWVPGRIGSTLRVYYYRMRGAEIGREVRVDPGVSIDHPDRVIVGDQTWLDRFVIIIAGEPRDGRETRVVGPDRPDLVGRVHVGRRCHIAASSVLSGIGGLEVGDDVTIAAGSCVYSLSHHYRSWSRPSDRSVVFSSQGPTTQQSMLQGPVVIAQNVGVGVHCLILPGTEIGAHSFVRPFSVVQGSWPENSILAGNPATSTAERFTDSVS